MLGRALAPLLVALPLAACAAAPDASRAAAPRGDAAPAAADRPGVDARYRGTTGQGRFAYAWVAEPDPIPFNERFALRVTVTLPDEPGRPLPDATLEANAMMPEHGHGMNTAPRVTRVAAGTFLVEGMLFHMPGLWHLVLVIKDGGAYDSAIVPIVIE